MEINLISYSGIVARWKEKSFFLFMDELLYGNTIYKEIKMTPIHYGTLSYPTYDSSTRTLQISIASLNDSLFLKSISNAELMERQIIPKEINDLELFRSLNEYYIFLYITNLSCNNFVDFSKNIFNVDDIKKQLDIYLEKKTFYEILEKINMTSETKGMIDALRLKFEAYDNEINSIFQRKKINTKSELKLDYEDTIYKIYIDSSTSPEEYDLRKSVLLKVSDRKEVVQIGKIFFNTIKTLTKVRNSLMEVKMFPRNLNLYYKNDQIFNLYRDIISASKQSITNNRTKYDTINLQLTKDKISLDLKNIELKSKIKQLIDNSGLILYYCFRCGNILTYNKNSIDSNCLFDDNCTSTSLFSCKRCKIDYCSYCVQYYKNKKCYKNHILLEFDGCFNKECVICSNSISDKGYGCNICEFPLCSQCNKLRVSVETKKCDKCKTEFYWKRSTVSKCEKCHKTKECFWFCKFCLESFCAECIKTNSDYCGANHLLEVVQLNSNYFGELDFQEDKESFWSQMTQIYHYPICSLCQNLFPQSYKICKRCNYVVCNLCLNDN